MIGERNLIMRLALTIYNHFITPDNDGGGRCGFVVIKITLEVTIQCLIFALRVFICVCIMLAASVFAVVK